MNTKTIFAYKNRTVRFDLVQHIHTRTLTQCETIFTFQICDLSERDTCNVFNFSVCGNYIQQK